MSSNQNNIPYVQTTKFGKPIPKPIVPPGGIQSSSSAQCSLCFHRDSHSATCMFNDKNPANHAPAKKDS